MVSTCRLAQSARSIWSCSDEKRPGWRMTGTYPTIGDFLGTTVFWQQFDQARWMSSSGRMFQGGSERR
jgi:hypothetical protein